MIRDTDEQPSHMEEMSRTRCVGRGTELPCPLQARRAPQIRSAGPGLWRLHDTDVTDELTRAIGDRSHLQGGGWRGALKVPSLQSLA